MIKDNSSTILVGGEECFWPLARKWEQLERSQWLFDLSSEEIRTIASFMTPYKIPVGMPICREGDREAFLCIICDGVVDIVKEDSTGFTKVLSSITRGKAIGEMSLIDNEPRSATVITQTETTIMVLKKDRFLELAEAHPRLYGKFIEKLARVISQRLRQSSGQLAEYI